jgi:hypothetical protein
LIETETPQPIANVHGQYPGTVHAILSGQKLHVQGSGSDRLRIPTKPATNSERKPATDSDLKPAGIPI